MSRTVIKPRKNLYNFDVFGISKQKSYYKATVALNNNAPKSNEKSHNNKFCFSLLIFFSFIFHIGNNRFWQ